MEKQVSGKRGLFTAAELDLILCALVRQQSDFRSRLPIMEKYAGAEHLANHRAKLVLGEQLLKDLS
jgi:hypothetical protein